ncbi:MAG TPA: MbcA/ParS/Xre antitoxin family protein [Candidatus Binatia bacterium]|nr:MbcA/ParS/Xre antitoxin family protein [Candidatus Binatia bacterium]
MKFALFIQLMRSRAHARPAPDPEAVLAKAALSAARCLGLTNRDLARILGTSEASVSRLHRQRALRRGSRESELAALFVRLFRSLDTLTGGDEAKARAWYDAPNAHLGGVPAERVSSVEGLVSVVQYLDAMRGKL